MDSTVFRVIHLTDSHVLGKHGTKLHGVDSFNTLASIVNFIKHDSWTPDLVIFTGDLSDDGSMASYQRLRNLLLPLGFPIYCIPGNHDDIAMLQTHLEGDSIHVERLVTIEPWQIVLLDSQVPGQGHGFLNSVELDILEETLQKNSDRFTLVGVHHGPFPVCSMPLCQLENADALLKILERYPKVRCVISGHNHCAVDKDYYNVRLLVTPSTYMYLGHPSGPQVLDMQQFREMHPVNTDQHGFRRLELFPDGEIVTNVIWDTSNNYLGDFSTIDTNEV